MSFANWLERHMKSNAPPPPPIIAAPTPTDEVAHHSEVTQEELVAGTAAVRAVLEESGYSSFVSDEQARSLAAKVLDAAARARE